MNQHARVIRTTLLVAAISAASWTGYALQLAEDPNRTLSFLVTATSIFVGLPVAMAVAIWLAWTVGCAILAPIAVGDRLLRHEPTGFRDLAAEGYRIGTGIVPGYIDALRRVRQPVIWGFVLGSVSAVAILAFWLHRDAAT